MIQKLRKKLIIVLMAVVCLFLVGILVGLFVTSKSEFERRSVNAFREPPTHSDTATVSEPDNAAKIPMPIAIGKIAADGSVSIVQNQLYYLTDEELIQIVQDVSTQDTDNGLASKYDLRYRRLVNDDGSVAFFFSDTYMERNALNTQLLYSCVIGIVAIGAFFGVSMLLSRWMVRPVERAWEKQRQFVADASHELKTPLTVVLSNADMLAASGAITDEKNKNRLENIRAESQRMKGLVENLLTLARSDSKPALTTPVPINLSYLVNGATLTLEPTIFDMGRTMDCQAEENLTVSGDADQLRQLVDILLDNANKYGKPGTPITVRMSTSGKRELLLSVESYGSPLPAEECQSIFERFYRSDKSRGEANGYGLGLSIAQTIVKEHGGKIWAQSDGVEKNTFYVRLPTIENPERNSPKHA